MIKTVIKREFLDNLISFRFIACVLVAVVLISISTFVLTNDYRDRLEDYDKGVSIARDRLSKVSVYSQLEVAIFKKPSPLSIFIAGEEGQTGNYVYLTHREIPTSLEGAFIKNEFARIFSFFDLSSVIVIIFTILTILLSYNSVSGEKEEGMLSLILSNSIARYKFLLGKYIGGLISIVIPLTFCFIAGVLIVLFSKGVDIDSGFFISILLLYAFSIFYLSSILLIGILVSSRTRTSFNSLIFLLAFYLIATFLLPVMVQTYSEKVAIKKAKNYENNVNELTRERNNKIREARAGISVGKTWSIMSGDVFGRINPEQTIEFYKRYFQLREEIREDYALRTYEFKREDMQIKEKFRSLRNLFLSLLPPSNFERLAELAAGTGQDNLNRFFQQLTLYWHQYVRYLRENAAFSLKYFFPGPEELTPEEKELISKIDEAWQKTRERPWWKSEVFKKARDYNPEIKYLSLDDMPLFIFHPQGFFDRVKSIFFNILILIFYNVVIFTLGYFSFSRYDPRMEF